MSQVDFNADGSCWIEVKAGRKRWFGKDHAATKAARNGLTLDGIGKAQRAFAAGTHEHMIFYRDAEGKVGIPPDPNMIPAGCQKFEVKSLAEADALSREMTNDLKRQFADDAATDYFEDAQRDENGNTPREVISRYATSTEYEREVRVEMLKHLDKLADDRNKVDTNVFFDWRES